MTINELFSAFWSGRPWPGIAGKHSFNGPPGREKFLEVMMKIAVPMANSQLATHFGHCEEFALIDVDWEKKVIMGRESIPAPPHEPGLLPKWLAGKGVDLIIAGGMGQRAKDLFTMNEIKVVVGAPVEEVGALVTAFMTGGLRTAQNPCDH